MTNQELWTAVFALSAELKKSGDDARLKRELKAKQRELYRELELKNAR